MSTVMSFFHALWAWLTKVSLWLSRPFVALIQKFDAAWSRHGVITVLFVVLSGLVLLLRSSIGSVPGHLLQIVGGTFVFGCGFSIAFVYFLIQTEREQIANGFLYHKDYYHNWGEEEPTELEQAADLPKAQYIHMVGKVTLGSLLAACLGMALGFSLVSQGLYLLGLKSWYHIYGSGENFGGWLLYSLLSIFRAIDIFDTLPTFDIELPVIRHASLFSSLIVFVFKIFFDLMLLSQLRSWWTQRSLIKQSIQALKNPLTRERAAETLRRVGRRALPEMLEQLEKADSATRIAVIQVLGQLKAHQAIASLLAQLKISSEPEVRMALTETLGTLQAKGAIPALVHALQNDPNEDVRTQAAYALTELRDISAMDVMFKALETEKDEDVRSALIEGLGILTPEKNLEIIQRVNQTCLKIVREDRSDLVRRNACQTLAYMEMDESVPVLTQVLRQDSDGDVREAAADALGAIASDDAIPALLEAIQKDTDDDVRSSSVAALSTLDAQAHADLLIKLLESDPSKLVRRSAAYTLGELGIKKAENALQTALKDPSIREAARDALAALYYDKKASSSTPA